MNQLAHDTRATLRDELKIIPGVAWLAAAAVLLCWILVAIPLILEHEQRKPEGSPLSPTFLIGLLIFSGLVLAAWVVMVFYVSADAGRRQMNRLLWTLLVIFIPNAIGFIVYFLVRKPIGQPCAKCRAFIRPGFSFCPACGEAAAPLCPACHRQIESGWVVCAYCGARLSGG
ncbi:MAG: zinc ribbon domain-containing protein [Candidatus Acidiferrales bacterium]